MNSEIPQEVKLMLIGHMEDIWNLTGKIGESDFMLILTELCKGAFIAGQADAVNQLKKELIK